MCALHANYAHQVSHAHTLFPVKELASKCGLFWVYTSVEEKSELSIDRLSYVFELEQKGSYKYYLYFCKLQSFTFVLFSFTENRSIPVKVE